MRDQTVIIMRHAKSDWDGSARADYMRPLSLRGERDARRMGAWLAEQPFAPGADPQLHGGARRADREPREHGARRSPDSSGTRISTSRTSSCWIDPRREPAGGDVAP